MRKVPEWIARAGVLNNDNAKGPWGSRGGGAGGSGGNGDGGGSGPRNPWAFPGAGARPRAGSASLDEFLKRARGGGGGGGQGLPGQFGRLWLLAAAALVALWVVFTSFHSIGPQERGVASTLGRYSGSLGPGIRMTLPAPFTNVRTVDVEANRTENFPEGSQPNLMLTGDQNIIDFAYSVRWNIKNPEDYVFEIANPDATVRAVAESAMRAAVAGATLQQAIGAGRGAIEAEVQTRMQALLDEYQSGVRVLGVAIKQAAAPAEVDDAFKAVTAAQQAAQADQNQARAYAQSVIARAQGDAAEFDRVYEQYRQAPDVTRRRLYYETMEQVLQRADKTVVEPGVQAYLPLPEVRRRAAEAAEPSASAPTPAPAPENRR